MKPESEPFRMTTFTSVMKYFGMVMALLYVAAGLTLVLQSHGLFDIPGQYAIPLGISLMGYGVFRGYRLYQKYFQKEST